MQLSSLVSTTAIVLLTMPSVLMALPTGTRQLEPAAFNPEDDVALNLLTTPTTSSPFDPETCVPKLMNVEDEEIEEKRSGHGWDSRTALGVCLDLLSCLFSNLGLLMEKRALNLEQDRLGSYEGVVSYKLPLWWAGFLMFAFGQIVSGIALNFVSIIITAPLGSFSLVINLFTTTIYLKERVNVVHIASSLVIVLGCVLTTVFAPWSKASDSLDCFRVYVSSSGFHIAACILLSILFMVLLTSRVLVMPSQKQTPDQKHWPTRARFGRWLYPIAAGMTAVWSLNIGAALMRLVGSAASGNGFIFENWEVYVCFVVYIFCIAAWQMQMNECNLVLDATYVIPINFALLTLLTLPVSSSLHGTLDKWHPQALPLAAYLIGSFCCILGMVGLVGWGEDPALAADKEVTPNYKQAAMEQHVPKGDDRLLVLSNE